MKKKLTLLEKKKKDIIEHMKLVHSRNVIGFKSEQYCIYLAYNKIYLVSPKVEDTDKFIKTAVKDEDLASESGKEEINTTGYAKGDIDNLNFELQEEMVNRIIDYFYTSDYISFKRAEIDYKSSFKLYQKYMPYEEEREYFSDLNAPTIEL